MIRIREAQNHTDPDPIPTRDTALNTVCIEISDVNSILPRDADSALYSTLNWAS